ncbi:MAG: hypothetical protein LBG29_07445 [Synergistaceae bacterium]|jgi:hypothetical protein|nr:hypothetical protein [Synergistaceae bacterium]
MLVSEALEQAIKDNPGAKGWIRGDSIVTVPVYDMDTIKAKFAGSCVKKSSTVFINGKPAAFIDDE